MTLKKPAGSKESAGIVKTTRVSVKGRELSQYGRIFQRRSGLRVRQDFTRPAVALDPKADGAIFEDTVGEAQLDILAIQSMGLNLDLSAIKRVIPINLYLGGGENSKVVLEALHELLNEFDFEPVGDSPPKISSFFKRLWSSTATKKTLKQLEAKLQKLEEALTVQQIDKPNSEVTLNEATAAAKLLDALGSDSKSTALHVGKLLILVLVDDQGKKHNRIVTLNDEQVTLLQGNLSLLYKPELLLQRLTGISEKRASPD